MALTVDGSKRVWEAIAEFDNRGFSEDVARMICAEMSVDDEVIPADGFVCDHFDLVQGVLDVLTSPDILDDLLYGDDSEEPFRSSLKIDETSVEECIATTHSNENYTCMICLDEKHGHSVKLACGVTGDCVGRYCKQCVVQWITICSATCPYCRQSVVEITPKDKEEEDIKKVTRRRLTISLRKRNL